MFKSLWWEINFNNKEVAVGGDREFGMHAIQPIAISFHPDQQQNAQILLPKKSASLIHY